MNVSIRTAQDKDKNSFVELSIKLSQFNRENHCHFCKSDDFQEVLQSLRSKAEYTFLKRNDDMLILMAVVDEVVRGYALARIICEEPWVDNGSGRMGLFDELYLDESARGLGLGQEMIDRVMNWMEKKEIKRVKLHAYSWNHHARKLYERNGFQVYVVGYEKHI